MNMQEIRAAARMLMMLAICGSVWGCQELNSPEPGPEALTNDDAPTANDRLVAQAVVGDVDEWSNFWELAPDGARGFYFIGGYNSKFRVGHVDLESGMGWHFRTTFEPRGLFIVSSPTAGPDRLVVAGKQDVDSDGESEVGYVSVLSSTGNLESQIVFAADSSDVWLNAILPVGDSTFLVAGGVRSESRMESFIASVALSDTGELEKIGEIVIAGRSGGCFTRVALDPDGMVGDRLDLYAVYSGTEAPDRIEKLAIDWPGLETASVSWSREVSPASSGASRIEDLRIFDGNLYLVGHAGDLEKERVGDGDDHWDSGVVASFTAAGDPRWMRLVGLTAHSERFHCVSASPAGVYAVGSCAGYVRDDHPFAYGWTVRLSDDDGEVEGSWSLGSDTCSSGFRWGTARPGTMHLGGWTNYEGNGDYQGWLCEVDVTASEAKTASYAPLDPRDRNIPPPRDADAGRR